MMTRGIAVAVLAALAGCGAFDSVPSGAVTKCQVDTIVPGVPKTDILFVVDDSGSMQPEQQNLAASFDAFITRLASLPVKSDFQIGVTNTSVDWPIYDRGASGPFTTVTAYGDGRLYPAGALVAAAGRPRILQASSPTLVDDFKANVDVGTSGASKEQGLRAAQLAVTQRITDGTNAGFLRPGARLAVIIVTDEDDCSDPATPPAVIYPSSGDACHTDAEQAKLPPVSEYVSAFRAQLAGEARDVVVAVIAGVDAQKQPVKPACSAGGYPAKRYKVFVDGFGAEGLIDDVCQADFTATLQAIAGLISSQTLPLSETPADWRLLAVTVAHEGAATRACQVALAGSDTSAADAVYTPPQQGRAPSLTFQRGCALEQGDQVHVQVLCAG